MDKKINQEIKKVKTEINDIQAQEIKKNIMYMKQMYYKAGSKSAKLLAYSLKKQVANNHIYKIKHSPANFIKYRRE